MRPASSKASLPAFLCVLGTLASWSAVPLFLSHFANHIDAWTSNGWRYAIAALFWLPVLLVSLRRHAQPGLWRAILIPTAFNILGQISFALAHYQIDPGLLTFGLRFQIVCVTIGAALLFPNERSTIRRPSFLLGLSLVLAGTIVTISTAEDFGNTRNTLGIALALAAGALFAAYSLSVRKCLADRPPVVAFAAISQLTAIAMITLMLLLGKRWGMEAFDIGLPNIALLVLSAIVGIALGHVLFYISMARLGVAAASGVIQLQPFITAIGSTMIFHEQLSTVQWIGGIIAVAGAGLILRAQARARQRLTQAAADFQSDLQRAR